MTRKDIKINIYNQVAKLCNSALDALTLDDPQGCDYHLGKLIELSYEFSKLSSFFYGSDSSPVYDLTNLVAGIYADRSEYTLCENLFKHPIIRKIRAMVTTYSVISNGYENQIALVFPGLGKTSFCRKVSHAYDLDFGHLRKSLYASADDYVKSDNVFLLKEIYLGLANSLLTEYNLILMNDYHPFDVNTPNGEFVRSNVKLVLVPTQEMKDELIFGIRQRGHDDFADLVQEKFESWVDSWVDFGLSNDIPVIQTELYLYSMFEYFNSSNFPFDSSTLGTFVRYVDFKSR